jgi:hypothetical protein
VNGTKEGIRESRSQQFDGATSCAAFLVFPSLESAQRGPSRKKRRSRRRRKQWIRWGVPATRMACVYQDAGGPCTHSELFRQGGLGAWRAMMFRGFVAT